MRSPTQQSLKALRDAGYVVQVVETFNHFSKTRKDLFGGIDILAIKGDETLGVQTTSGSNVSARVKKLIAVPEVRLWLCGSNRTLQVHGWRKVKPRGQKRPTWKGRVVEITLRGRRIFLKELEDFT